MLSEADAQYVRALSMALQPWLAYYEVVPQRSSLDNARSAKSCLLSIASLPSWP